MLHTYLSDVDASDYPVHDDALLYPVCLVEAKNVRRNLLVGILMCIKYISNPRAGHSNEGVLLR